ncbi:hypothetical protein Ancab_001771 [Ancistrocladus abbreviatus]
MTVPGKPAKKDYILEKLRKMSYADVVRKDKSTRRKPEQPVQKEYSLEDNRSDGACSALKRDRVADGKSSGREGNRSDIIKTRSVGKCVDDNLRRTPSSSVNEVSKGVCNGCADDELQAEGSVTVGIAYPHNKMELKAGELVGPKSNNSYWPKSSYETLGPGSERKETRLDRHDKWRKESVERAVDSDEGETYYSPQLVNSTEEENTLNGLYEGEDEICNESAQTRKKKKTHQPEKGRKEKQTVPEIKFGVITVRECPRENQKQHQRRFGDFKGKGKGIHLNSPTTKESRGAGGSIGDSNIENMNQIFD